LNSSVRESVSSEFADQELVFKDLTKIPGYYKKKISNDVTSVQEFVNKLYKSQILSKFFSQTETNFAGITDMFQELYTRLSKHILADSAMVKDHRSHIKEIHEFIMFQLHSEFFSNQQPSQEELQFQMKCNLMFDQPPSAYNIPDSNQIESPEMKFAWKLASRQLSKISEAKTPRTKLVQVGKAIEIIQHAFEFCLGKQICADDLVAVLPWLFIKSKVPRLLAQFLFVEAFHRIESDGDQVEVYMTNWRIVIQVIKDFKIKEP